MSNRATKLIANLFFLASAALAVPALAAEREPQNQVQLSASATVDVQQDMLTMSLSATREGSDPAAVQVQVRQALEAALAVAKPLAQEGAMDVRTGQFSLQPRYNRDSKIVGWVGNSELVLEGRDFARIGGTAGKLQSLVVGNVSFSLSREARAKAEAEAQGTAIDRFKKQAVSIAKGFGFADYGLREISVSAGDSGFFLRQQRAAAAPMMAKSMAADAEVPLEAGKTTVTVTVSGSVQLK